MSKLGSSRKYKKMLKERGDMSKKDINDLVKKYRKGQVSDEGMNQFINRKKDPSFVNQRQIKI